MQQVVGENFYIIEMNKGSEEELEGGALSCRKLAPKGRNGKSLAQSCRTLRKSGKRRGT